MKTITVSAIALTVATLGFTTGAEAQTQGQQPQPPGKLFFEGDIVRHALPDQAGPFCVLVNQYKHKEAVAFRIRVMQPNGQVADDKVLKSLVVELGNGQRVPAGFKPHGAPPTDYFWSLFWTIPADHPTGPSTRFDRQKNHRHHKGRLQGRMEAFQSPDHGVEGGRGRTGEKITNF